MTTKINAKLDTNTVITSGLPALKPKPAVVVVTGPVIPAMQQIAALVRLGYVPDPNLPLDFFGSTGAMSATLILGTPDTYATSAADETMDNARSMEAAAFAREVEKAAARQIAAAEQAKRDAQRAELLAAHAAAVAKLDADLAAVK